jgi:hypothetical protein
MQAYLIVKQKVMNTKANIWFNRHIVYIIKLPLIVGSKSKFYDIKQQIDIYAKYS